MLDLHRRTLVTGLAASAMSALAPPAHAQSTAPGQPVPRFGFEDVIRRAHDLGTAPFEANPPPLPDELIKLDFDAWRDIRFRRDKAFLAQDGGPFRLEMFHLGHLYPRPVTINIIREGIATPVPYSTSLFDYGRNKIDKPLPVNLGFAGFRLLFPLNRPDVMDEVVAFLGASYFRFLGRRQHYGMSARGLTVNAGLPQEEFPFFREFWIEAPTQGASRITIYALLDGESVTGAFRFDLAPGNESVIDIDASLFPRKAGVKFGIAPLTSMFFTSQNDRRFSGDFRPELHDSDGLLLHSARASGSGARCATPRPANSRPSSIARCSASACCSATGHSRTTRTSTSPTSFARAIGSSHARRGAKAASNSSSCRPPTRPTTTSSPPGRRATPWRSARR